MRVINCITHFSLGGAEQAVFSIIRSLHKEVDFIVFTVQGGVSDDFGLHLRRKVVELGISVFEGTKWKLKYGGFLEAAIRLIGVIKNENPTAIHLHTEIPELTYAIACKLDPSIKNLPVIRTIHNSRF